MRWSWFAALVACSNKSGEPKPAPAPTPKVIIIDAAPPDPATRFAELRDQRALRCMLERVDRPNTTNTVLAALGEIAHPAIVRAAAFSLVELAKTDGERFELAALTQAIHTLGPLGDVEGLRLAFARIDQIMATSSDLGFDEAYRTRVTGTVPAKPRDVLASAAQLAMAGDPAGAAKLYDAAGEQRPTRDHVAVLVALGRQVKVRELIATAPVKARADLVDAWLVTAARMQQPLGDVVSEMLSAIAADPETFYPSAETVRAVARAADKAAAGQLRAALIARLTPDKPGVTEWVYELVLDAGSPTERSKVERFVEPSVREHETLVRTGPLAAAVDFALADVSYLPRVWARAVVEGDAAAFAKIEAKLCRAPAAPPTPAQAGFEIVVTEKPRKASFECARVDLDVQLVRGEDVVGEQAFTGECTGACTAGERRAGAKMVREIEARIARGEATDSELDYDFTSCFFAGHRAGRIDTVGARRVAIFAEQTMGAHSTVVTSHKLAFEACGALFVSQAFGGTYVGGWPLDALTVEESPDHREVRVRAEREGWRGFLYRATLPACPAAVSERVLEGE